MSSLTDRYVYAATRFVTAENERSELDLELRERIADTVDALTAAGLGQDDAERQALIELGDPLRVSAAYRGRPMQLIGPRYYFAWLRITVPLVVIVPAVIGTIDALGTASARGDLGEIIASGITAALTVALHVAFWTTLVFAIMERVAPEAGKEASWSPDLLPEVPTPGQPGRRADLVASLVFLIAMGALLVWQRFGSPFFSDDERLPVLDPALWPWGIGALLALLLAEAAHAVWVYRSGWSWPAALVSTSISVAFGALLLWLLMTDRLLNPAFVDRVGWDTEWWDSARPMAGGIIALVIAWEIGSSVVKTARERRPVSA